MKAFLIHTAALLIPLTATAADGWQKIKWGMTQEEAEKAWPELEPSMETAPFELGIGTCHSRLALKDYSIGDLHFMLSLLFDEQGKVRVVKLDNLREPVASGRQYEEDFEKLVTLLRRKYGTHIVYHPQPMGDVYSWVSGNQLITASHLRYGEGQSLIQMIYQNMDDAMLGKVRAELIGLRKQYVLDGKKL